MSKTSSIDLDALERLLPRYGGPGPRYTSYPTAPVWSGDYAVESLRESLGRLDPNRDIALYAHVPFCTSLCHFCACNRVITQKPEPPVEYLDHIALEIAAFAEAVPARLHVSQLHWGGGTPTHLSPAQIELLFRHMTDAFPLREDAEISIEVDPRVTTDEQMDALATCGFNRISLGVQDTNPATQKAVHRIQPFEMTRHLTEGARARGFESVNFDLIYGLPYQTEESFAHTLDEILEVRPDRIALYAYAHVTWVAKQQRGFERKDLPDPATRIRIMLMATRRLLDAGYRPIGMDHFAVADDELSRALDDGTLRRNFMGYTTQEGLDVLAFGPSAISELPDAYAQSEREIGAWQEAVRRTGLTTMRGHLLSPDDVVRRWLIGRIMCHGEVRAADYAERFGGRIAVDFSQELERLEVLQADGLIRIGEAGGFVVEPLGRLLVRHVAMAFDAYLPEQQKRDQPLFSRTV
ncbi:MAG: oxygen-independent coproporphyrinogen III oxidase [Deltaproteobacteria bacterium]|nr:oxygen-independent coproporphyrinogen III oxidase [Deltaproteobacteria bacterium]MBW2698983.1 oxygen-independent coproporphyrinogen III oxidase [Deltaproteobacteria bacterium]